MTKNLQQVRGTPVSHRRAKAEDGHRKNENPPRPVPKNDSSERETADQAQARLNREGGKD